MPDRIRPAIAVACAMLVMSVRATATEVPKVHWVELAPEQPHATDPNVIWYDDFDVDRIDTYMEPSASSPHAARSALEALGGAGMSMECHYPVDSEGVGNRKLVFGDSPIGTPLRSGEQFTDIHWRIYVKHQPGWTGSPDKLSRATGFVSASWNQAFIAHVWSAGDPLTLDPATGVVGDTVVTTTYNDFLNLDWLGNSPVGLFPLHSTSQAGRWVCVESRIRLNTPGLSDGYAGLWVDGVLDAERTALNWRGSYTGVGINAVFLEAWWNTFSSVDQYRWYDDFVVSTSPIGPIVATTNPTVAKTPLAGCTGWEFEIATDNTGTGVVWTSGTLGAASDSVVVDAANGSFVGSAAGATSLPEGATCFCRVRQQDGGGWSTWSAWHQPFVVEGTASTGNGDDEDDDIAGLDCGGGCWSGTDGDWTGMALVLVAAMALRRRIARTVAARVSARPS